MPKGKGVRNEGITPACAGKTRDRCRRAGKAEDHPRLRGKNYVVTDSKNPQIGSPPLAREKRIKRNHQEPRPGITPACAGKTTLLRCYDAGNRDHPRLRGKNLTPIAIPVKDKGSPPLAREKRKTTVIRNDGARITPACAGKTNANYHCRMPAKDHPRLRGKNTRLICRSSRTRGSPPLAREKRIKKRNIYSILRITPACAGKTRRGQGAAETERDHPRLRGKNCL